MLASSGNHKLKLKSGKNFSSPGAHDRALHFTQHVSANVYSCTAAQAAKWRLQAARRLAMQAMASSLKREFPAQSAQPKSVVAVHVLPCLHACRAGACQPTAAAGWARPNQLCEGASDPPKPPVIAESSLSLQWPPRLLRSAARTSRARAGHRCAARPARPAGPSALPARCGGRRGLMMSG